MNHRVVNALQAFLLLVCWIGISATALADQSNSNHLAKRKLVAEMLATAVAFEMDNDRYDRIDQILRDSVHEDVDVLSAAVRQEHGEIISQVGNHSDHWTLTPGDRSTPTQLQVPLYGGGKRIMTVELRFNSIDESRPPGRLYFADVIALHISPDWLTGKDRQLLTSALSRPVKKYRYVLSAAVRRNGELVASVGDHTNLWRKHAEDSRLTKRLTAPVYQSGEEIAIVEVTVKTVTVVDVITVINSLLF